MKMFEDVNNRPALLEEPFVQTLSGKMKRLKRYMNQSTKNQKIKDAHICTHTFFIIEECLEVKLSIIWTDGKAEV